MNFFTVRHVDTGHLLPPNKRSSKWDFTQPAPHFPRLFKTKRAAQVWIRTWVRGTASRSVDYPPFKQGLYYGAIVQYEPIPGRHTSHLEIVPVTLSFGDPL